MKENDELKSLAKNNLQGNWLLAILVCAVAWLLTDAFTGNNGKEAAQYIWENGQLVKNASSSFNGLASLISFLIGGSINFGLAVYFLHLARNEETQFSDLFTGFQNFFKNFLLHLLITVFTILWFMLLIIPGFIALLKYSMAFYIIRDNPDITPMEAIRRSSALMYGHKARLFFLLLSFIGWFILGIITFGLGFLYLYPYYNAAKANFYLDLLQQNVE